jgi:hypothetical protein
MKHAIGAFAFIVSISIRALAEKIEKAPLKCVSGYGNEVWANMDNNITFCSEHSGKTCCNSEDTTKIKAKIGFAKMRSEVSD